ncbi:hypothetical protein [Bacillus thuringiensis]|uniref:hypothetical protein n=1 Tax=Bacillus thuringiensis TaxID=1428 RepID=UPI0015590724|nr:hypothetical protein [Bacillus thuringiensis]
MDYKKEIEILINFAKDGVEPAILTLKEIDKLLLQCERKGVAKENLKTGGC